MIWNYSKIKNEISADKYYSLEEGNTPIDQVHDGDNLLLLKREDQNPTGSWKDRGTAFKLTKLIINKAKGAVIASSGNAAISLLTYAKDIEDFEIHVVVSPDIHPKKKELLENLISGTNHQLHFEKKAKRAAAKISHELGVENLKASIDSDVVKGYWSLGFELGPLVKQHRDKPITILMAASSGTTAVGTAQGLDIWLEDKDGEMPKYIISQTSACHPLIPDAESEETTKADAIVDKSMLRKPQLEKIIRETEGEAHAITSEELERAKQFIESKGILDISYNGVLPIASYLRMKDLNNSVFICVVSGR